jgi:hypothetical protein
VCKKVGVKLRWHACLHVEIFVNIKMLEDLCIKEQIKQCIKNMM